MDVSKFFGKKAIYDKHGQMIHGVQENGHHQLLLDVRGWGAIQNLFKNRDGSIRFDEAYKFQDEMGEWIAQAINEKMQRETK